jgi:hypothetical protein
MQNKKKWIIGLVAPALDESGGVQSIVEMLVRQIEASGNFSCLLISLATSSSDALSTQLRNPASWFASPRMEEKNWRGRTVMHVGCRFSEFEFFRYRRRALLDDLLMRCDVIQVVGGFSAWGAAVLSSGPPVSVWAATRCEWERSTQLRVATGPRAMWRALMTMVTSRIDDRVMRTVDRIMVMNPLMQEYVASLRPAEHEAKALVAYAPPGVDGSDIDISNNADAGSDQRKACAKIYSFSWPIQRSQEKSGFAAGGVCGAGRRSGLRL